MWTVLILSIGIGLALGLFGGGGSILTVPMLVYAIGVEPKLALAMSLLVVGLSSGVALILHARAGNVRWRTGLVFGAAGMAGAYGGGSLAAFVAAPVLLLLFAGMMLATSVAMWRGRAADKSPALETPRCRPTAKIVVDGLVVGAATGLVGAGGGFLVVPALALLGDIPMAQAVGTSLLVIAMKSFAGFAGYAAHVEIDYGLALAVSGAAAAGAIAGARLTNILDPERLRRGFAAFVFVMSLVVMQRELPSIVDSTSALALGLAAAVLALLVAAVLLRRFTGDRWSRAHG